METDTESRQGRHAANQPRRSAEGIAIQVIGWLLGVIEAILGFRFALKLFGANPEAGFVELVYGISAPLMAPFEAVFPAQQVEGAHFEWSVLLAMVVYALVAWGLIGLIRAISPRM